MDSAAAALLLKEQGHLCEGAMMRLCGNEDAGDARAVTEALGIPFHIIDAEKHFQRHVITPFAEAYRAGRTPNPCVNCNRQLKFGVFLDFADSLGFASAATGHYARAERDGGRFLLKKGLDPSKDQSYVLYALTQRQLGQAVFPLGGLTKKQVRELSHGLLPNAHKLESQDICFVPDGDYAGFIERYTNKPSPKGRFTDTDGNDLGEHRGLIHYTVGQRRGLGLNHSEPLYVKELRPESNTVVVGMAESLFSKTLTVQNINLIAADRLDAPLRAKVKIRYRHPGQPATVTQTGEDTLHIAFDAPQRAVTPGQAAVIYQDDIVIGGGTICQPH